jgi:hypothetical protein
MVKKVVELDKQSTTKEKLSAKKKASAGDNSDTTEINQKQSYS